MSPARTTVGVISDTHGLLRPEAVDALHDSDLIVHAGDVGDPAVLERLRAIAPTTAVRGNVDRGAWARALPVSDVVDISGHSHRPGAEVRNGVLYLNPGSAGRRRFALPVTVARLHVVGPRLSHEIVELRV